MGKHSLMAAKHAQMYRMKGVNTVGSGSGSSIKEAEATVTLTIDPDGLCQQGYVAVINMAIDLLFDTEIEEITSMTIGSYTLNIPSTNPVFSVQADSNPSDNKVWMISYTYNSPYSCIKKDTSTVILNTDKGQYSIVVQINDGK